MDVFAPLASCAPLVLRRASSESAASPFGGEAQMWRYEIIYLSSLMSTMSSVVRFFTSTKANVVQQINTKET